MRRNLETSYFLLNDIDCTDTNNWNEGAGFIPVGSPKQPFIGSFDGAGYAITGLYIDRPKFKEIGIFGTATNADIHDVTLKNFNITGKENVAAIVGQVSRSEIYNVNIQNLTLEGQKYTGAATGSANKVNFNKVYTESKIRGARFTGGLIGFANEVVINESYTYGIFTSDRVLGGLIGQAKDSKVISSYSNSITVASRQVGGLIGVLAGLNEITKSYSASTTNGEQAGGLIGSYQSQSRVTTLHSFFDKDVSGIVASPAGAVSRESEEMYQAVNFTDWDFDTIWFIDEGNDYPRFNDEPAKTLALVEEADDDSDLGLDSDSIKKKVITISTCTDLEAMKNNLKGRYVLRKNLNCAETALWNNGQGFEPIGIGSAFTGSFDGGGHYIKDLVINRPETNKVGLFSFLNKAKISDLRFINVDVTGSNDVGVIAGDSINTTFNSINVVSGDVTALSFRAGAIAGNTRSSKVVNSFTDLDIIADREAGGIFGKCISCSLIESGSYADITTDTYSGGLIGFATSPVIRNSYSQSNLTADRFIGGLIAFNENTARIVNSYASNDFSAGTGSRDLGGLIGTGDLVNVESSYWNRSKGLVQSFGGGEGKTTAELQDRNTFKSWDFKSIWILVNSALPVLR